MKHIFILSVLILLLNGKLFGGKSYYPVFSWDTVPLYLHFGKEQTLSEEELHTVARLCSFVGLEKGHGRKTFGSAEKGIAHDAARLKKINPEMKILFYWNTFLCYPFTSYTKNFEKEYPDWVFRDKAGKPLYKKNKLVQYNLLNTDFQKWWASVPADAVTKYNCDGIFMDAVDQSKRTVWMNKGWGKHRENELTEAVINMMKLARKSMGNDSIIMYNGIKTKKATMSTIGRDFIDYADAVKFEHFDQFESGSRECILRDWETMKWVSEKGKIIIVKAWPDHYFNWLNKNRMKNPYSVLEKMAREKIIFSLACFLIGAREYTYFCYSWGYRPEHGVFIDYPEYHKPLGPPKDDYKRVNKNGWIFTREFEHASVRVDLKKRKANIVWRK